MPKPQPQKGMKNILSHRIKDQQYQPPQHFIKTLKNDIDSLASKMSLNNSEKEKERPEKAKSPKL